MASFSPPVPNQELLSAGGAIKTLNAQDEQPLKTLLEMRNQPTEVHVDRAVVMLTNLEAHVCATIAQYDAVCGCVAWFTNYNIIRAMSAKPCRIAVQKEEWLRADNLRQRYNKLSPIPLEALYERFGSVLPTPRPTDPSAERDEAVRVVGTVPEFASKDRPLMHHKFLVFYRAIGGDAEKPSYLKPCAVWTGSANFSKNMNQCIENAVFLESEQAAAVYHREFCTIYGYSSPLDWTTREANTSYVFDWAAHCQYSQYFSHVQK